MTRAPRYGIARARLPLTTAGLNFTSVASKGRRSALAISVSHALRTLGSPASVRCCSSPLLLFFARHPPAGTSPVQGQHHHVSPLSAEDQKRALVGAAGAFRKSKSSSSVANGSGAGQSSACSSLPMGLPQAAHGGWLPWPRLVHLSSSPPGQSRPSSTSFQGGEHLAQLRGLLDVLAEAAGGPAAVGRKRHCQSGQPHDQNPACQRSR